MLLFAETQLVFLACFLVKMLQTQDNIFEFSPNQPHCLGEEVNLTYYLFPTTQAYIMFALISFNQTLPESVSTINAARASIGYSATVVIPLMGSSARIQLTIASFKESDQNTLFGCHAELSNNASVTGAIASGYPPPIATPPSTPTNFAVSLSAVNCTNTLISWTAPASNRDMNTYYLYRNGTLLVDTTDTQFVDRDQLMLDTHYIYSVKANSCAGSSSVAVESIVCGFFSSANPPTTTQPTPITNELTSTSPSITVRSTSAASVPSQPPVSLPICAIAGGVLLILLFIF